MLENLDKELRRFARNVVSKSRSNLTRQKRNASKGLYDSIDYDLKSHANSFSLDFVMEEYGMFLDKGVRGSNPSLVKNGVQKAPFSPFSYRSKMPPLKPIFDWVKFKKIRLRDKKGKYKPGSYKSLAFIIQKRIFAQGLKPSLFFTKPFAAAFKNLPTDLVEAFSLDVADFLKFTLKSVNTGKKEGPSQFG